MSGHESVQEQLARWNPQPTDRAMEFLVGQPREEGDTRATVSADPMGFDPERNPSNSKIDAQRLGQDLSQFSDDADADEPEVPTDEDGNPDYDSMRNADLKDLLAARDLPTSGRHDDLVARLEEDDAAEEDGDDEE